MGYVVTFYDYRPIARFDNAPWRKVEVWEAVTASSIFAKIDEITLTPVDADPSDPMTRYLTTANATAPDSLWYKLVWRDAIGNSSESQAIFNGVGDLVPEPDDVALLLRSRLRDDEGNLVPDFSNDTSPTIGEVRGFIQRAVTDVQARVAVVIPADQVDRARNIAVLHAAAAAERSYFPELTDDQRDTFVALNNEYNTAMTDPDSGLIHECRHPFSTSLF